MIRMQWLLWYKAEQLSTQSAAEIRDGRAVHETGSHTRFASVTSSGRRGAIMFLLENIKAPSITTPRLKGLSDPSSGRVNNWWSQSKLA